MSPEVEVPGDGKRPRPDQRSQPQDGVRVTVGPRRWQRSTKPARRSEGSERDGTAPVNAGPAAEAAVSGADETGVAVTVVPGFHSPRPNVWIRNLGPVEVVDLQVTHEPRAGGSVAVGAPSPRLLQGEACVVTLPEAADGEVRVAGRRADGGSSTEFAVSAVVPADDRA